MSNNAATRSVWRLVPAMALLVALALILAGPFGALARSGPADLRVNPLPSIYFSPSPIQIGLGAAKNVDVRVDNVQGLYAVELRIAFPNSLVQVIDADAAEPGVQIQSGDLFEEFDTYLIQNRAENTAGLIEYVVSITGSQVGKSGSGIIATIPLQGMVGGDAVMSFVEVVLAERDGTSIPYIFVSNHVDIIVPMPPTATPTASLTPTGTATATEPVASPTPSQTPTFTPTFTPGPAPTSTYTGTPTSTFTPAPMTEVHVVPITQTMGVGDLGIVQVAVQHAADLYGLDVRLDFNGALLDVEDADPAIPGIQVWSGDVFEGLDHQVFTNWVYDDGVFGQVHFAATLSASNPVGVSGDAVLFWITFRGAMPGTSAVTLAEVQIFNRTGTTMPRSLHHASVTLTTDGEPATPTFSPTPSLTLTPTPSATPVTPTPTSSPTPGTPTVTPTGTVPTVPSTETPTPTETGVLVTPTPVCGDRIVNGGFENIIGGEAPPWVRGGSVTYTTIEQHSGARSAWLGGYNNADDQVYQEVTIPDHVQPGEETTQALLSYWWGVLTNDPPPATDFLYIRVRNTAGELLETLETISNASITGRWQQSERDLSAYKGQTIRISFEATTDGSQSTSFFIDDVTLIVCEILLPTPTATATLTATATSTSTPSPTATETGLPTATPTTTPIPIEVVVQDVDGATGRVRDSYLDQWNPTTNYGNLGAMSIRTGGIRRPIIAFDLAAIPSDATILGAMMELCTSHHKSHPQDMTVSVYGVKRAWREMETTWNVARTGVAWGQPGADDTVGDRDAVPTTSQLVPDANTWYAFDITPLVQAWVSGARPNEGMVLLATGNTVEMSFWSSQYGTQHLRPRLVVRYIHGALPEPTETPTPMSTPDGLPTATLTATPEGLPTATPTAEGLPTATPTASPIPVETVLHQADGATKIVRDSYLNQWEPKTNYGHQGAMSIRTGGIKRPIITFDLAGVPAGATILDARLELYTSHYKSHPQDMTVSVYGVRRAWREMEITWNVARTDVSWGQPGAADTVADRDAAPTDSQLVSTTNTWYGFDITALAQAWVKGTRPNEGMVLDATGNTVEMSFWASEYSVPNLRPRLVLRYILGDAPPPATPVASPTPGNSPTPTPTLAPAPEGIRVTLQDGAMGYTGTQDAHISQWQPTTNYGGNVTLLARQGHVRSMLVRFDVSSIPAGATIHQATLSLYALSRSNAGNLTIDLYEVKRPWAEGQATWELARTGQPWAQPGCSQPGADLAATPTSSQLVNAVDTWFNWEVTDLVQLWLANPASNRGMILKGDGPTSVEYSFASSEYWWSQHYAPKLTIRYTQ